jgi:glycine/D-amino acid oxidase-like deaminating enzyme
MTFPAYPDRCGWSAMLPPRMPKPPAQGTISAKYAVVGAGYTGVAAARRLAELDPGADIVLLEATTVSEGSAARNSGFASPADIDASEPLNRCNAEGFQWLVDLAEQHGIDCELRVTGRIKGAATAAGTRVVQELRDLVEKRGIPHAFLDTDAMRQRIGTRYYRCGLYTEIGHLLQPAALIQGLADSLPATVRLHENAPVVAMENRGKWHLRTPDASVTAETVVMATNSFIKQFGYLRGRLVTIYTYAGITQELPPAEASALGSMPDWGLLAAHRLGTTVRRVGANRLMVRSLYAYEKGLPETEVRAALRDRFHRRYPELSHIELEYVWGGTTALTMNGAPCWGRIDERLYASAGCNGAGIVKGTLLGKRLAELITGQTDGQDVRSAYGSASWVAPDPFRWLGFQVVSAIERRRAGLEA